ERSGKMDSLDIAVRYKRVSVLDVLIRDHRIDSCIIASRLSGWLPVLRPLLADRIKGCVIASALSGELLSEDAIVDWIFPAHPDSKLRTLVSIFQFILVKRPTPEQLSCWIGECNDREVELAI